MYHVITVLYYTVQHLVGAGFCEGESREYEVCNTDVCFYCVCNVFSCHTLFTKYSQFLMELLTLAGEVQCAATDGVSFNGQFHAWELFTGQCT